MDIEEREVNKDEIGNYPHPSYSPALVSEDSVGWIQQCRAICWDPHTETTFISGPGCYEDSGFFEVEEPGDDPEDTQPDFYQCYDDPPVDFGVTTFPFHEACYTVLAKRLGYDDPSEIDKHALCAALRKFNNDAYSLGLDYGGVETEQNWCCRHGEEHLVSSPSDGGTELRETFWALFPSHLLLSSPALDLTGKIQHDPFSTLPPSLLAQLLSHLPIPATLSLMQASHHICTQTRDQDLWKDMIETHITPWFWELRGLVEEQGLIDYKGAFVWLEAATRPGVSFGPSFLGVANRRRIWGACGQLLEAYMEALQKEIEERGVLSDDEGDKTGNDYGDGA